MQIEELLNEGLKREYKVTVAVNELNEKLDAVLNEFRATAKLNGFRPGKAPLSLLKKMYGERAQGQVISEAMQETSAKLFEEKEIRPALRPEVDMDEYKDGTDLEYTLKVEILPEVNVEDFKAPALERWVAEVADKDLDEALERIAGQQKSFKKAAKTAKSKEGDAVLIDYLGRIDGEAFDGGAAEDHQLELGSGMFIPGFEDQLVGSKAGEEKIVKVTFPAEYHSKDLAGKEAEFTVNVKEVRRPAEAEVNDELAKNLGLEDLDGLKEALKGQLEADNNSLTRAHLKRKLLDSLADSYDFAVPAGMVDLEFAQIWEQIKRDAVMSGEAKAEDFEGKDAPEDEAEAAEFRAIAERRVRLGLLLSEIGVKNEVQVTQEEVNRKIIEEARRFPGQESQVFEFYQKNEEARAQLRAPIFEEKVVDFVIEQADLTDKTVSREDLEAAVREIDEEEANPVKAKKTPAKKKAPAKKAAPKKAAAKKAPAKKAPAKKAAAKKADKE
ncbi:trigger factor [Kordiimonas sp. SCSIO 12603]|uniref:trigger factor n=1 Tax=Kordiimonas sp. SCSIO 12603 TaxID=2829596 RepID=UPI0021024A23|nr:trigger factor [Kordiimonas sp. SCSIO 12603]UTW57513.1 trigger factor [Kordiimonas sp. SCSIO 12603]